MKITNLILSAICALSCSSVASADSIFHGKPFDGFYVGGQGGYGSSDAEAQDTTGLTGLSLDLGTNGWMYGVLGGWGTTLGQSSFYVGIEGQYNWVDRNGEFNFPLIPFSVEWETDDEWNVGGRLGYLLGENTMVFARAAYTSLESDVTVSPSGLTNVEVDTLTGFQLGLGVEHHIGSNFTLRGEYVFSDYGNADITIDAFSPDPVAEVDDVSSEGRISLSYSF